MVNASLKRRIQALERNNNRLRDKIEDLYGMALINARAISVIEERLEELGRD